MKRTFSVMVCSLALFAWGCGSSGGGGGSVPDVCQNDPGGTCSGECAFEPPSDVDCSAACANIAAICNSGCTDQCTGLNQDQGLCGTACEATKNLRCSNLVFGCYADNNTCNSVGSCVVNGG